MDLTSLLGIINQMGSGNPNNQMSNLMNFFNQNKSNATNNTTNNDTSNSNPQTESQQNQNNLNFSQIMPFLSMMGGGQNNLANIFPMLNNLNLPNGFGGLQNMGGMQNLSPILSALNSAPKTQNTEKKQTIIRSQNFNKNFNEFKRL